MKLKGRLILYQILNQSQEVDHQGRCARERALRGTIKMELKKPQIIKEINEKVRIPQQQQKILSLKAKIKRRKIKGKAKKDADIRF